MKITKQKTWMMIEIIMAAFLIISSCEKPGITVMNTRNSFTNFEIFKPVESVVLQTVASLINPLIIFSPKLHY